MLDTLKGTSMEDFHNIEIPKQIEDAQNQLGLTDEDVEDIRSQIQISDKHNQNMYLAQYLFRLSTSDFFDKMILATLDEKRQQAIDVLNGVVIDMEIGVEAKFQKLTQNGVPNHAQDALKRLIDVNDVYISGLQQDADFQIADIEAHFKIISDEIKADAKQKRDELEKMLDFDSFSRWKKFKMRLGFL